MLLAGSLMACTPDPVTYCPPRPLVMCEDCCVSEECVAVEPGLVLKQGTVMWYDMTTETWKPIAAVIAAPLPDGIKWGLLKTDVSTVVDCGCTILVTSHGLYVEPRIVWPTGISAADKKIVKNGLWHQHLLPIKYVA